MPSLPSREPWAFPSRWMGAMDTIPLSNLVPEWQGQRIPEAYSALEKGLRHQRAMHLFSRYIVISWVQNVDYDGAWDYVYFDAGLKNPLEAANTCARVLRYRMLQAMVQFGPVTEQWKVLDDVPHDLKQIAPRIDVMAWEKRGDGTGYNSIRVYVGVFEVKPGNPLTSEDLAAIGLDSQVIHFLATEGMF